MNSLWVELASGSLSEGVSANPGCSLQIKKHLQLQGKEMPLMHSMELLDYLIRGVKLQK